ncbi:hypothetical protein CF319_g6139 [Tilletia indica]|nr:hypothetical protein CF319_g6139 [Tilletia indica]
MDATVDEFPSVLTTELRSIASHYFPNQGSGRKKRDALIALLIDNMIKEEISHYSQLTRRQGAESSQHPSELVASVRRRMDARYKTIVLSEYFGSATRASDPRLGDLLQSLGIHISGSDPERNPPKDVWPQPIPRTVTRDCFQQYRQGTQIEVGPTCAVCARRSFNKDTLFQEHVQCTRINANLIDLDSLQITDEHIANNHMGHFEFGHDLINGLALDKAGVHVDGTQVELDICAECKSCLTGKTTRIPRLSLANGNIRGQLPEDLQDITWLEERLCAKYLASAFVIRLYGLSAPSAPEHRPRVMKGHACSFPLNTISTATKLPWAVGNGSALVSCLVIGPRKPRIEDLKGVFRVRRAKVLALLDFLRGNFLDFPQWTDEDALNQLPADDIPELLMRNVLFQQNDTVHSLFETETSGLELHPALSENDPEGAPPARTFLEHHGMLDVNGTSISSHERSAAALANATGTTRPDLVVRYGSSFVEEYHNPGLFPGMFPTLFPWGTGGFESERAVTFSFKSQASHLLDLSDAAFRRHWSYIFVVANIKQRRAIHLGTSLACKGSDHARVTKTLQGLDLDLVKAITQKLSKGVPLESLNPEEKKIKSLLSQCDFVSKKVPGSRAMMNQARADIRGYVGEFGIFHLFLTLNPSPVHSPVFQIFFGDTTTKLELRAPAMPNSNERGLRVADDPVAATDYFHFHIHAVFKFLFGWDAKTRASTADGGILGSLAAFYLVKEHTMRGQLHGHSLIWLKGGLNPSKLRERMKGDGEFQQRYLDFFDSIIQHHIPPASTVGGAATSDTSHTRFPRQECPPNPDDPSFKTVFQSDHHILGGDVQRHQCRTTCYKGERKSCRFLYPHEINPQSHYDVETNSINLRIKDPTINWHNPTLLVATRHNHDLKAVQSGRSGVAAAAYITSYTTKSEETPANQVSMIQTVLERMASLGQDATELRSLLCRCVMQFGRERQVHAQQAATYVRDLGDTFVSHTTIPMLSGSLLFTVISMFGPIRAGNEGASASTMTSTDTPTSQETAVSVDAGGGQAHTNSVAVGADEGASEDDEDDDCDEDPTSWPLNIGGQAHQVGDYMHRGPSLSHLTYYDFVRFCKLWKLPAKPNASYHPLSESHPNFGSKCHRYTPEKALGIPRAIFSRKPRSNGTETHGDLYCAAMLAHFVPFTINVPLKAFNTTYEEAFQKAQFSSDALRVMDNWAALAECDDARDAEQLLRRKREAFRGDTNDRAAAAIAEGTAEGADNPMSDLDLEALLSKAKKESAATLNLMAILASSRWFESGSLATTPSTDIPTPGFPSATQAPTFTKARKRQWTKQIAEVEAQMRSVAAAPRASTGALAEALGFDLSAPETTEDEEFVGPPRPIPALSTIVQRNKDVPPHELIQTLVTERTLTASQALAFKIAARHFFQGLAGKDQEPLRLFMHGEAGTGKTVVVRLLRELLERYGKAKEILFVAPTGKAACAIGGTTQHSTFALYVHAKGLTHDELTKTQAANDSGNRIRHLQESFRPDQAFGGVNVLFAGDLCQLAPVGSAALYSKMSLASRTPESRTKMELGRAAWLEVDQVVDFTEQKRMVDADMAAALSRLRLRACTQDDATLFNQSVLRSSTNPNGVTLAGRDDVIVLARTNETVRTINFQKALSMAKHTKQKAVICAAEDDSSSPMTSKRRESLLCYNGATRAKVGLGRIPIYKGMPVVYRGGNQSVGLGITNGAFATVHSWDVRPDKWGNAIAEGIVLHFPSASAIALEHLDLGCIPILPTSSTFHISTIDGRGDAEQFKRMQLPIQGGFAMTVHSAQGMTSTTPVVVDLRRGGFDAYVSATRATKKSHLLLVAAVNVQQLNSPGLPQTLKSELNRLSKLARHTKLRHDHDDWTLEGDIPGKRRREDDGDDAERASSRRRL